MALDKDHGRLETQTHRLAKKLDWLRGERHYPGAPRFPNLKAQGRPWRHEHGYRKAFRP